MRGFTVIEAESAEKALELLEDTALHIDVFVTDVVMPGMDGPTWVQEALIARPNVNVVFVSGYAEGAFQGKTPNCSNQSFCLNHFPWLSSHQLCKVSSTFEYYPKAQTLQPFRDENAVRFFVIAQAQVPKRHSNDQM